MTNPSVKNLLVKFWSTLLSVLLLLNTSYASAEEASDAIEFEFSGIVANKFLFRGFDLNNEDLSIQAGVDAYTDNNFSASLWFYEYDYDGDDGLLSELYLGYDYYFSEEIYLTLFGYHYMYSGEFESTTELGFTLGADILNISYYRDIDLRTKYYSLDSEYFFLESTALELHYGLTRDSGFEYYDYYLGLSHYFTDKVSVELGYSDHEFDEFLAESTVYIAINASF